MTNVQSPLEGNWNKATLILYGTELWCPMALANYAKYAGAAAFATRWRKQVGLALGKVTRNQSNE